MVMTQEIRIESKLNRQGICIGSALKWNKRRQVISEGKTLMIPASLYYTAPVKEPIYGSIWLYMALYTSSMPENNKENACKFFLLCYNLKLQCYLKMNKSRSLYMKTAENLAVIMYEMNEDIKAFL